MFTHWLWNSMAGQTKKVKEMMCIYFEQTLYIHNHQISSTFELSLCKREQIKVWTSRGMRISMRNTWM